MYAVLTVIRAFVSDQSALSVTIPKFIAITISCNSYKRPAPSNVDEHPYFHYVLSDSMENSQLLEILNQLTLNSSTETILKRLKFH